MKRLHHAGIVLFCGVLAACGGPQPTVQDSPGVSEPAPQATAQPDQNMTACDCADTYRVAVLLPLSGPHKELGAQTLNGAMMGFYELHNPAQVELRIFDTRSTPDGARSAALQAVAEDSDILIGPIFSAHVDAAAPIAASNDTTLLALSNDRHLASRHVRVLGPHLETEAYELIQQVLDNNGQDVLLIAPKTEYGERLAKEMNKLSEEWPSIALDQALFSDPSVDGLTRFIREVTDFRERSENLKSLLQTFKEQWQDEEDVSIALTQTVDTYDLNERWDDLYPPACREVPEADTAPSQTMETAEAALPTETNAPEMTMELEGPPLLSAYEHTRVCEPPAPVEEGLALDGYPGSIEAELDASDTAKIAALISEDGAQPPLPAESPEPQGESAQSEPSAQTDNAAPVADDMGASLNSEADVKTNPYWKGKPSAVFGPSYKDRVQNARLDALHDLARCITYLSEKEYEVERGLEAIQRTFEQREVLGPPKYDTIILPLGGDQLRLAASLFDYYHVGRPDVMFLGTSLWDKTQDLGNEPSLQGGKWLSISRPFSSEGSKRFKALFKQDPGYIPALAYDAVRLAFEETQKDKPGRTPPSNGGYIVGESGVFRINNDGTNRHLVSVHKLGQSESRDIRTTMSQAAQDRQLQRMCLGR